MPPNTVEMDEAEELGLSCQITVNVTMAVDQYRFSFNLAPAEEPEEPTQQRVITPGSSILAPGLRAVVA